MTLLYIIIATLIISILSLIGALTFLTKFKITQKAMMLLVAFAAGTLLATSFFELLPEAVHAFEDDEHQELFALEGEVHSDEETDEESHVFWPGIYMFLGIALFYIIEKFIHWHHHHDLDCHHHVVSKLSILGDIFHNFLDGLLIAAAFSVNINAGIVTTIAIAFHEIPQELGDLAILLHSGYSKSKAMLVNFISACFSIAGGIIGFFFLSKVSGAIGPLIAITAGAFLYIALADIIPEIHKNKHNINRNVMSLMVLFGIVLIFVVSQVISH